MTKNKDFGTIMKEITSGLSGDAKSDMAYLEEQMEKYKNHELNKEILRACGRLIYGLIPDDKKEELKKSINNNSAGTEAALEEVRFNIYKKDFRKALRIMEALVSKTEDMHIFEDDTVSEYHVFDEPFEEILYRYRSNPAKDLRQAQLPYTEIYMLYGSLLVELKRYSDAKEALCKGLRWNPVCFRIMSEYIEIYKITGDLEKFFSLTKDAFKIAFRSADVARCYRNLGYYFVEKKLWSEAIACYLLSLQYDHESRQAQAELYYINSSTDGKILQPSIEQVREYGEKYGFPIGANGDVLGIAISHGKHFMEQGAANAAKYFLAIAYDLTGSEEILKMIEQLPQETQE